jgi:hypothetical protein
MGEGQGTILNALQNLRIARTPHSNPLPVKNGEREQSSVVVYKSSRSSIAIASPTPMAPPAITSA